MLNRDDIIRLTRQVGGSAFDHTVVFTYEEVRRFMDLVAAAEREACARVCEAEGARVDASWASCAAAIRARGQQEPDDGNPSF
jgi:hypothetical protein